MAELQHIINMYHRKLVRNNIQINVDDEKIIASAKYIIKFLEKNLRDLYSNNALEDEQRLYIYDETFKLINEIDKCYRKWDIIEIFINPMCDFYDIADEKNLYNELKEYMKEVRENKI